MHRSCPSSGAYLVTSLQTEILAPIAVSNVQYPLCLSLLANKKIDVLPLVTHRLGFTEEEVVKGFDTALRSAETKAIKVMFNL